MSRSREKGENEFTREAVKEAARTGEDICSILARWRKAAKAAGDSDRESRIRKAEKFMECRDKQKRRSR